MKKNDARTQAVLAYLRGHLAKEDAIAAAGSEDRLAAWTESFIQAGTLALARVPTDSPSTVEEVLENLRAEQERIDRGYWPEGCPLRTCQFRAFQSINDNLTHYRRTGRLSSKAGRYIVQMATGTGKSGVIALCSYFLDAYPRVLIVVPSDTLRMQLRTQMANVLAERKRPSEDPDQWSFWKRIGVWPARRPVLRVSQGADLVLPKSNKERHITITTPHSVNSYLQNHRGGRRKTLAGKYDLLVFDEGHKKAAPKWSDSVDSVGVPILLFTATPYRSDGRPLHAEPIFRYTYVDAISAGQVLKPVEFRALANFGNVQYAVDELADAYRTEYSGKCCTSGPRLMVRASSCEELERVVRAFATTGLKVIGVHSHYRTNDSPNNCTGDTKGIPEDVQVIVHQHMLLEGYDDPRISMIAFLAEPDDSRIFVQQVGRAVRWNRTTGDAQRAIVYHPSQGAALQAWEQYLAYEQDPDKYVYYKSRFCRRVEALDGAVENALNLRPSVQIRIAPKEAGSKNGRRAIRKKIEEWIENSQRDLRLLDASEHTGKPPCISLLFERSRSPTFLDSAYYVDVKLEIMLIVFGKRFAFVHASLGRLPDLVRRWELVGPDAIARLVPADDVRVHAVQLRNLHVAAGVVRARSIWADDASRHVIFSRDGSFAPISLGWSTVSERSSRSVTFSSSRFNSPRRGALDEFLRACAELESLLVKPNAVRHELFERVAQRTNDMPSVPYVLQIDLPDDAELRLEGPNAHEFAADVESNFLFAELAKPTGTTNRYEGTLVGIRVKGKHIPAVAVEYDVLKERYDLSWDDDEWRVVLEWNNEYVDLLRWCKERRRFAVAADNGVIYAQGRLFRQREPMPSHLRGYIESGVSYSNCTIEVPRKKTQRDTPWPAHSAFARFENEHLNDFTTVICDDGSGEWADFLAFDTREGSKRLVMVHLKCSAGGTARVQIGDLYAVCAQAVKNTFHLWEPPDAERVRRWREDSHTTQRTRCRRMDNDIRDVKALYRDPHARREVWVVQVSLDIAKLRERLRPNLSAGSRRIAYLIDQIASSIAAAGATFRLFGQ